ncbi:uncharacterized protein MICPUCDRAFT_69744 [Micromonas pusilla CCMP1545]|uniref:Predicted protein n=1 Tax=Micromonas pusilla (strain CCMP1545) TaxID=564608 RepID=C1MV35_MICPC|nr:uncharacterized protein MICPUCDRAFT_69744 [Micromonas pusilla CCMP1545]EEH56434.1 predicted protein [Micromonas pusilla CCMP1545]|eukprot:XP_003059302.1 predicted protein [Micromonas pusilla CCMP1545]
MFAGKDKRFELIRELQVAEEDEATHRAKKITEEERAAIADANDRTGRAGAGMLGLLTEKNHGVTQLILMQTDLATRRREERALNYAAARIQAVCRGRATRKAEARRRAEEEASGGLPDIASFEPEEIAHVTRIQSSFRGRSSRRNMRLYGTPSKPKDLSKDLKEPSTPPIPPPPPANKEPAAEPATPPRAPAPKEPEEEDLDPLANLSAEDLEKVMAMQSSAKKIVDKKSLESELGEPLATLPADALGSSPSALVSAATLQRAATARLDDVPAQPRVRGARGLASAILLQSAAATRAREVDADAAFEAKMDAALEEPLEAEKAKEKMPENDASASIESIEDSAAFRLADVSDASLAAIVGVQAAAAGFLSRAKAAAREKRLAASGVSQRASTRADVTYAVSSRVLDESVDEDATETIRVQNTQRHARRRGSRRAVDGGAFGGLSETREEGEEGGDEGDAELEGAAAGATSSREALESKIAEARGKGGGAL